MRSNTNYGLGGAGAGGAGAAVSPGTTHGLGAGGAAAGANGNYGLGAGGAGAGANGNYGMGGANGNYGLGAGGAGAGANGNYGMGGANGNYGLGAGGAGAGANGNYGMGGANGNYGLGAGGAGAGANGNYGMGGANGNYGLGAGGAGAGGATKMSGATRSSANDAGAAGYGAANPYGSGIGSMYSNSMGGDGGYGAYGAYGGGAGDVGSQGGMDSMYGGGSMYGMGQGGMGGVGGGSMMGFDDNLVVSKVFSSRRDLDQVANNSDFGRRYDSYWGSYRSDITGNPSGTSFRRPSMASLLDENSPEFEQEPSPATATRSLGPTGAGKDNASDQPAKRPRDDAPKTAEEPPVKQSRGIAPLTTEDKSTADKPEEKKPLTSTDASSPDKYAQERAAAQKAAEERKRAAQSNDTSTTKTAPPNTTTKPLSNTETQKQTVPPKQTTRDIVLDDVDDIPMLRDDIETAVRVPPAVAKVPSRSIKPDSRPTSRSGVSPTRSVEAQEVVQTDDRKRPSSRAGSRRPSRPHSRALSMDDVTVPAAEEVKDEMAGSGLREVEETAEQRKRRDALEQAQKKRLEEARKRREEREEEEKKKRDAIAAMDEEKRRQREAEAAERQRERDEAKRQYDAQKAEEKEAARVKALMEQREREAADAAPEANQERSASRPRSRRPRSRGPSGLRGAIPEQPPDETASEIVDQLANGLGDDSAQKSAAAPASNAAIERPRSRQRKTPTGRSELRGAIPEQPEDVEARAVRDTLGDQLSGRGSRNSGEDGRHSRRKTPTGRPGSALRGQIPEQPPDEEGREMKDTMEGNSPSKVSTSATSPPKQTKRQPTPLSNGQSQRSATQNNTSTNTTNVVNESRSTTTYTTTTVTTTVSPTAKARSTVANTTVTARVAAPQNARATTAEDGKKTGEEPNNVRTLVLVEKIAKGNKAVTHQDESVTYGSQSCTVTEVKERNEDSFNYQSSVVHDVREAVCAGYNAAVLSSEAPNTASRFDSPVWPILNRIVRSVLQVNSESDGQLKSSFELSCALGYICDDKVKDLLAEDDDSPFEKMSVHPSPIYGPRIPQLRYGQITSGNAFEEVLSACLTRASENAVLSTMDRGVATALLLLKQVREENGSKDVYLSSILVSSAGSDIEPYASGLSKAKNDYASVFHLVLGGPCLTCYMLNTADDDNRKVFGGATTKTPAELKNLMTFLQQIAISKNYPLRSGSVKRFIKYVEKANEKARAGLSTETDDTRRKKLEKYVKEQDRLLAGAYKMLQDAGIGERNSPDEL